MQPQPLITSSLPGTGGAIKGAPEDFIVEEIPAYPPSGDGDHLFLTVEKRGISTQEMVRRVARALNLPPTAIGVAGQKDQQSISRQVISVPAEDPVKAANLKLEGVEVLSAARHRHKLRTGHLRGNRFTIAIRGAVPDAEARAKAILARLSETWLPNFFGVQRFGRLDENIANGRALLRGELKVHDRFRKRFLVSAYQSALFNRVLARRIEDGALHRVVDGEVLQRTQTGGLFYCAVDEILVAQARLEKREIVPTGPMFGHKMFQPRAGSPAAEREKAILDEEGIDATAFERFGKLAEGTRRALLAPVETPSAHMDGERLVLTFALPSGTYATVLLEEVMKPEAPVRLPAAPSAAPESDASDASAADDSEPGDPSAD